MTAVRAVTWDAAGTLIRVAGSVGAHYAARAAAHGLSADAAALDAAFPAAFRAAVDAWAVPYGRDEADARAFWARVVAATFAPAVVPKAMQRDLYDHFARPAAWEVLPGARAALAAVQARGLPQAVVSNFDGRLGPLLAGLGLGPFAAVVTSAQVGAAKPDPAPLRAAAAALAVAPAAILHVGDSAREDGGASAAAGARWLQVDGRIDAAAVEAACDG
jgi:putative hydrolase of the HAD superfamily